MSGWLLDAELHVPGGPRRLRLAAGGAAVVDGPSAGEVVAALAGTDPGRGRIVVAGRELGTKGLPARVRAGLVLVGDDPVAGDVSVRDHLAAIAGTRAADALLAGAPLLSDRGGDRAGVLSGGERRVLGFLRAAALEPEVVVLDRAGAGLDDAVLAWAGRRVAAWRSRGIAIVIRPSRPEERAWGR